VSDWHRSVAAAHQFAPGTDPATIAAAPPAAAVYLPDPEQLRQGVRKQTAYARAVLEGESATVSRATKPGRKKRLFASAASVGRLIDAGVVPGALFSAGLACGLTPPECERNIRRGFQRAT
jgi:hypothetical protein